MTTVKENIIFAALQTILPGNRSYGNLNGKYPVMSLLGNAYVLVIYQYNTNAILVTQWKNREKATTLNGYISIYPQLRKCGCKPELQKPDNKASELLQHYIQVNKIYLQLAPLYMLRQNVVECAISTFKDHSIAIRAGCDLTFPRQLWCRLLCHAEITLNLM